MLKTIISLTTIPPRMSEINETLNSLINQSEPADKIFLNIPKKYIRYGDNSYNLPKVPPNVEIVICDIDYGPATKLLPTLTRFRGENVNIVYCDDDGIYPYNLIESLKIESQNRPENCISISGGLISQIELRYKFKTNPNPKILGPIYRKLYTLMKQRALPNSIVDIAGGHGGVLVKPHFFDDEVFKIPKDFLTVDDAWISGNLQRRGIDIYLLDGVGLPKARSVSTMSALTDHISGSKNQNAIEMECIEYFRRNYGIWV